MGRKRAAKKVPQQRIEHRRTVKIVNNYIVDHKIFKLYKKIHVSRKAKRVAKENKNNCKNNKKDNNFTHFTDPYCCECKLEFTKI